MIFIAIVSQGEFLDTCIIVSIRRKKFYFRVRDMRDVRSARYKFKPYI